MANVVRILDVTSVAVENDKPRYFKIGKVIFYDDNTIKMRLHQQPSQEFRLFEKRDIIKFRGRK